MRDAEIVPQPQPFAGAAQGRDLGLGAREVDVQSASGGAAGRHGDLHRALDLSAPHAILDKRVEVGLERAEMARQREVAFELPAVDAAELDGHLDAVPDGLASAEARHAGEAHTGTSSAGVCPRSVPRAEAPR